MLDSLALALRLSLFFLVTLSLLLYVGYGPAAVLLPAALRRYGWLLMPGIGYGWFAISASLLNGIFLPMTWATAVILIASTGVNLWAWRRLSPGARGFPFSVKEHGAVAVLALVPYLLGVLPLLHAGSTAFIGVQWDLEVYLPITEYLKRYPIGAQLNAPANPLIASLDALDFRGGSGWGVSYLEAGVGVLLGWPSYLTFRPLVMAVLCLSVPAWYVLARHTLKTERAAALLAAALWAVQGLSLWVASMGLAGHTGSYGLLPVALLLTTAALDEGDRRTIVLAGSAVAGLVLSFYTGALPFYAPPVAAWLALRLVRGPRPDQALQAAVGIGLATLVLAPIAHWRFLQAMTVYGERGLTQGWNVAVFSPVAEALGLSPFLLVQETSRAADLFGPEGLHAYLVGGWYLALAAGAIAAVGLMRGTLDRLRWAGLVLPTLAFVAFLRWGLDYPYGYFKALSLAAPLLIITLAVGAVAVGKMTHDLLQSVRPHPSPLPEGEGADASRTRGGETRNEGHASTPRDARVSAQGVGAGLKPAPTVVRSPRVTRFASRGLGLTLRVALLTFGLTFLAATALNTGLSLRYFWAPQRDELPRTVWELAALREKLPPGAPVYVLGRSGFDARTGGMVAYFLLDHPLSGSLETAYQRMAPLDRGRPIEYLLLLDGVAPEERGLRPDEALWRNSLASLYRAPERWAGVLEFEGLPTPVDVLASADVALSLTVDGWRVQSGTQQSHYGEYAVTATKVQPELTVLTFGPTEIEAVGGSSPQRFTLGPGIHSHRLSPSDIPGEVRLRTMDGPPPVLLGARLLRLDAGPLGPEPPPSERLVALRPVLHAWPRISAEVTYSSPDPRRGTVTLALEVYRQDARGGLRPYSAWELAELQEQRSGTARFTLDLESWTCAGGRDDAQPSPLGLAGFPPDGLYYLHLVVYHMGDQGARWPWLTLRSSGGQIEVMKETPPPPVLISYLPVPADIVALERHIPTGAELLLVPDPDPDHTFVAAAAGFLGGRRLFAAPGFPRSPAPPPALGHVAEFALMAASLDPRVFGYDAPPLWENAQTRLYRRSASGPRAVFRFPFGHTLGARSPVRVTLTGGSVRLDEPGSGAWMERVGDGGPVDVEAILAASAAATLTVAGDTGVESRKVALVPGVSLVRLATATSPAAVSVGLSDGDPVVVAALRVLPATGGPLGVTVLSESLALQARASSDSGEGTLTVVMEAAAMTDGSAPVIGLDVYNRGQCALRHYGYWAAALPPSPGALRFDLNALTKHGALTGPGGRLLPVDSATWPTGDGRYRAVAFLRQGDRTRWIPAASFVLRDGSVEEYRPTAQGYLYVLR